ncbi:MAG TPA: zinc-dependent peptidase [Chryseolinea sp.]|nr:zinc-dependent peptidase [Chryseolinea sp.]
MTSFIIILIFLVGFAVFYTRQKRVANMPAEFPGKWRAVLHQKVPFYQQLDQSEKERFEKGIIRFLTRVRITGVMVEVDITDKLLVASSAVIPVFGFPDWHYSFLSEVLLYPGSFDQQYEINSKEEVILGMVGSGTMEGKMILSKPALHRGFENTSDKQNIGIHEFIHLLDKEDGVIDGIPATLKDKAYAVPWLNLIHKQTALIMKGKSDINAYGATNEKEFLAVAGEYFFERPTLLQKNHPDLYQLLSVAFRQDTAHLLTGAVPEKAELERNDPCPCGSGQKFKKCCMDKSS